MRVRRGWRSHYEKTHSEISVISKPKARKTNFRGHKKKQADRLLNILKRSHLLQIVTSHRLGAEFAL